LRRSRRLLSVSGWSSIPAFDRFLWEDAAADGEAGTSAVRLAEADALPFGAREPSGAGDTGTTAEALLSAAIVGAGRAGLAGGADRRNKTATPAPATVASRATGTTIAGVEAPRREGGCCDELVVGTPVPRDVGPSGGTLASVGE
jgi:hypothetical protein